jgi:hypothetical protein
MESLPADLLYFTSQMQNFVRNTVKLNTLNTQKLASDGATQLRVALPVNAVANMKSLSLHCKMSTTGIAPAADNEANTSVYALLPQNGPIAVMDRVTVSAGGIALDNGVTPYHVVYKMRQNLKDSLDKNQSDHRVQQQSEIKDNAVTTNGGNVPANGPADIQNANYGQTKEFTINNFCGFTECHPAYLDLSLLPQIFVTVQTTASNGNLPMQVGPSAAQGAAATYGGLALGTAPTGSALTRFNTVRTQAKWEMEDIHFTLDVCQIGSGMYSALTERVLAERGSIDIPYPQFQLFQQTQAAAGDGSIRASVSCMSLDRVTGFYRQSPSVPSIPPTVLDCVGAKYNNVEDNFTGSGITSYQLTINNSPIPTFRPSAEEAFNFVVKADDRTYSRSRGGLVTSLANWKANYWCAHHRLCFDNDLTRISGTNVSSVNAQVSFQSQGSPGTGHEIMLLTEQTSILRCGQGRSCAVVY